MPPLSGTDRAAFAGIVVETEGASMYEIFTSGRFEADVDAIHAPG